MGATMFERNKPLRELSHYNIGGPADYFCAPQTIEELTSALHDWGDHGRVFIFGSGTNLLIDDAGLRGLVVQLKIAHIEVSGTTLRAGAGALVKDVLNVAIAHGLAGLEWAGGLPGTIGGAVRGNAGAFGGETKDRVMEVRSMTMDVKDPKIIMRINEECRFRYRNSIFKERDGEEIVVEAVFNLTKGDPAEIKKIAEEKINYRTTRHPIEFPNIGSIFKNVPLAQIYAEDTQEYTESVRSGIVHLLRGSASSLRSSAFPVKQDPFPVIPTACLLAEAGLKGITHGGAMISPKHPNFIVNVNHAKAADVKALIALVKKTIYEKFGVTLEEEVIYVE